MANIMDAFQWIILASLAVLIVMNAGNVATVVSSVGGETIDLAKVFTGSGYVKAR